MSSQKHLLISNVELMNSNEVSNAKHLNDFFFSYFYSVIKDLLTSQNNL